MLQNHSPMKDINSDFTIENISIRVSHFPQHVIPSQFLPFDKFRNSWYRYYLYRIYDHSFKGQPYLEHTMQRQIFPKRNINLDIFGHTHARACLLYNNHTLIVNVGSLSRGRTDKEPSLQTLKQSTFMILAALVQ